MSRMPLTEKKATTSPISTHTQRDERRRKLADVRQELVLDAARSVFFELGMEKTSIREIARRAGYTPGALYSYFPSKEHIYGALLGESLERLNTQVQLALEAAASPAERLRAGASAFPQNFGYNPTGMVGALAYWSAKAIREQYLKNPGALA